jgi:hypothetical protein
MSPSIETRLGGTAGQGRCTVRTGSGSRYFWHEHSLYRLHQVKPGSNEATLGNGCGHKVHCLNSDWAGIGKADALFDRTIRRERTNHFGHKREALRPILQNKGTRGLASH